MSIHFFTNFSAFLIVILICTSIIAFHFFISFLSYFSRTSICSLLSFLSLFHGGHTFHILLLMTSSFDFKFLANLFSKLFKKLSSSSVSDHFSPYLRFFLFYTPVFKNIFIYPQMSRNLARLPRDEACRFPLVPFTWYTHVWLKCPSKTYTYRSVCCH